MMRWSFLAFAIIVSGTQFIVMSTDSLVFNYDWNKDGTLDRFIFFTNTNRTINSDFLKFEIHLSGKKIFTFEDKDTSQFWTFDTVEGSSSPPISFLKNKDLVNSNCAAIINLKSRNVEVPILCVFGHEIGTLPGSLCILSLDKAGKPDYLYKGHADLSDILDMKNDGFSEIVLSPERSWCERYYKSYSYCDYTPFYVYSLKNSREIVLDTFLSAMYNKENYVGWVGFDNDHKYFIWKDPITHKEYVTYLEEAIAKYFK